MVNNVGSTPTASTKFRCVHIMVIISDCLSEDGSSILPRIANFLFRKTRARCMGVTVNHWLVEFDSLMRSQVIAEYGSGHPSGLISHEIVGSNPTSATNIVGDVAKR